MIHQRRKIGLISFRRIIPCPSAPPIEGVFHGNISIDPPIDNGERRSDDGIYQRIHTKFIKFGIKTSYYIQISTQSIMLYDSIVPNLGTKRLVGIRTGKGSNSSQQLHSRCRARKFSIPIRIKRLLISKIINRYTDFRSLRQGFQQ